jgi:hypothetical protein
VVGSGRVDGDRGGEVSVLGFESAAGLKEKSGRALMDFCLWCGIDPRRPAGYACIDIGRELAGVDSEGAPSGPRIGNEKSGLGMSSTGAALEGRRR